MNTHAHVNNAKSKFLQFFSSILSLPRSARATLFSTLPPHSLLVYRLLTHEIAKNHSHPHMRTYIKNHILTLQIHS